MNSDIIFNSAQVQMKRRYELSKFVAPGFQINEGQDICFICTDIKVQPVRCVTCRISFCKYCADKWSVKGNNVCPIRCSDKWEYEPASPLEIKLMCVYGCGVLETPDNFFNHNKICPQSTGIKYQVLEAEYLCDLGHKLEYLSDPYLVPIRNQCAACQNQKSICRNFCSTCKTEGNACYYCVKCRHPKGLTKTSCPVGHTDFYIKPTSRCFSTICDLCSVKVLKNGKNCVEDKTCDFAMCQQCYQKLQNGSGEVLNFKTFVEPTAQNMFLPHTELDNLEQPEFLNSEFLNSGFLNFQNIQEQQQDIELGGELLFGEEELDLDQEQENSDS